MIAIKDMEEMPNCCLWDCPLAREDGGACQLADVRTSDKKRPDDCPLVEIVTCKDCKYNYENSCDFDGWGVNDDYFCAKGERKENDNK